MALSTTPVANDASSFPPSVSSHHSPVSCLVESIGVMLMAVRRLKGCRSLSDSCFCDWLGRSCGRRFWTALTSSSSSSDLSICPMSTVRILASQLLSHKCRHTISKFFIMEKSVEESLEHIFGKHGSHRSCFLRCQLPPLRTLSCAQQVSVPIA